MKQGLLFTGLLSALSLGTYLSAQAGFEYVPPPAPVSQSAEAAPDGIMTPMGAPAAAAMQAPLEPVASQVLMPPPGTAPAPQPTHYQPPVAPVSEAQKQEHVLKVKTMPSDGLQMPPQQNVQPAPISNAQAQARLDVRAEATPAPTPMPLSMPPPAKKVAPEIQWNAPPSAPAKPAMTPPPAPAAAPGKLVINPYPNKSEAAAVEPRPASAPAIDGGASKVVGFGSDMPLALALQQIAPPGYTFSFGTNVNPGVRVSWDGGGRPWDSVIQEMIAPLNLKAEVKDHTVHIGNANSAGENHGAAVVPGLKFSQLKDKMRRENVTDPGESPKAQPLTTLESLEAAAGAQQQGNAPSQEPVKQQAGVQPMPLLPAGEQPGGAALVPPKDKTSALEIPAGTEPSAGVWKASQGDSLRETLGAWSKLANVEMVWNATHDYTVDADITVNDTFGSAVNLVVAQGVKSERPAIKLEDANAARPRLIVQDNT